MSLTSILPHDVITGPPAGFDSCTCDCHRMPGVMHFVPCCGPGRGGLRSLEDIGRFTQAQNDGAGPCDWDDWKPAREVA